MGWSENLSEERRCVELAPAELALLGAVRAPPALAPLDAGVAPAELALLGAVRAPPALAPLEAERAPPALAPAGRGVLMPS